MQSVAILGAGSVGQALGERLLRVGVQVCLGVRDPEATARRLTGVLAGAQTRLPAAAAADAELILLAVPAGAAIDAARAAGPLKGKMLLDCTNPLRWDDGPVWAPPPEGSVTQALAAAFPDVPLVRGFNHFGAEIQRSPERASGPADAFFAGDHRDAKSSAMALARRMGFNPVDAGGLRNAGLLENLAVLWIQLATTGGIGRDFVFRIEQSA